MSKGLPRSLSRGDANKQEVYRQRFAIEVVVTVTATGSAVGYGSTIISDLPTGNILILGATAHFLFAGPGSDDNLSDTWNGDFAIGITPAGDATLTGPDSYFIRSTSIGPAANEVIGETFAKSPAGELFTNDDDSKELNLNLLIDAADIVDDSSVDITVTGVLDLAMIIFE